MSRPEGAVALVTGAAKGIGSATARALAADGWVVAVNYRSDEAGARATVEAIEAAGGRALAFHADVANGGGDELVARVEQELGPVLALVNNAGMRADGLALQLDDEMWDSVLDTNLSAPFRLTRRAMRGMIRARFGRVVNVASVVGPRANAGQSNYAASKAGLIGMTKTIAAEVARRGVTVYAVAPGFIETDMTAELPEAQQADYRKSIPAGRFASPSEVAKVIAWLASDDAAYISGAVIPVDGGLGMGH
jgi:3-oxoacyl-[acyl-carrier protein] reductase